MTTSTSTTLSTEGWGGLQWAIFAASLLACISSAFVVLTYITFKPMRQKRFMKFIFYMSSCDLCIGIISLFGFPQSGSALCWAQGMLGIYFAVCSWLWTTALSYVTYCIVLSKPVLSDAWLHAICWLLPVVLALIPLVDTSYGAISGESQWCLIVNNSRSPSYASTMWSVITYFFWLFICSVLMVYWGIVVYLKMRNREDSLSSVVVKTYNRVFLYPFAMIAFWIMNFISIDVPSNDVNLFSGLSMLFGVSYGTATAVIFLFKSEEARVRWWELANYYISGELYRPSTPLIPIDFAEDEEYTSRTTMTVSTVSDVNNVMHSSKKEVERLSEMSDGRLSTIESVSTAPVSFQARDINSEFGVRESDQTLYNL
jgi:hypothetical protein